MIRSGTAVVAATSSTPDPAGIDTESKVSAASVGGVAWPHRRAGDFGSARDDLLATSKMPGDDRRQTLEMDAGQGVLRLSQT